MNKFVNKKVISITVKKQSNKNYSKSLKIAMARNGRLYCIELNEIYNGLNMIGEYKRDLTLKEAEELGHKLVKKYKPLYSLEVKI